MLSTILKKIFGSRNDRLLRHYNLTVSKINSYEPAIGALSDEELRLKTDEFRERYDRGEQLDSLLPEAFAVVREASKRVLGMRHFDVQLVGGMALHYGKIAEMRTGEGKTLVSTLPAYLNAISGKGVHIVTVNEYLAQRDAEWMGRLHRFLGLKVGVIWSQMPHEDKQAAYAADITYGTNNEFGFDYLRDNMVYDVADRFQRDLNFAIVDEVDSILIDEARTPLIISGQADDHTELYRRMDAVPPMLTRCAEEKAPGDYWVDEKAHQVYLSEAGHESVEEILMNLGMLQEGHSLYDAANIILVHHLYAALRAHSLYHRDQQYVVHNGEIVIVDEFTGRMMPGRRWSDGLHQAVEAKEGVKIQNENQTLASITFQNYFRMYKKLAGMTGTADTEAYEFQNIYRLETVVIPTNMPMIRKDFQDQVYCSSEEKYDAIIADIRSCHERGQPVLVGTTSIENSELLSSMLNEAGLEHQVLNAKQHAREAEIVAQAGSPGMITIATNMAGRGTDIVLGGNVEKQIDRLAEIPDISDGARERRAEQLREEWQALHQQVVDAGGLHIVGSERHESRRIDNQLRGRSGRQGDPGTSRFYLSLDDSLLRIFAGERIKSLMSRFKMPKGEPIEAGILTQSIESAQRKIEGRNFDIRKQLLEYDDVANDQRKVIYEQRNELLDVSNDIGETINAMRHGVLEDMFRSCIPLESVEEQWDVPALERMLASELQLQAPVNEWMKENKKLGDDAILKRIFAIADEIYFEKVRLVGEKDFHQFERNLMLRSLDIHWREHIAALDHLRQGIYLRSYAQKNPKQEYKREAFELFQMLLNIVRNEVIRTLMTVQIRSAEEVEESTPHANVETYEYHHPDADGMPPDEEESREGQEPPPQAQRPIVKTGPRIGRNDPCPCGSGRKYKQCHGKLG